ncbi:MAG: ChrB domain-containing protein [Microlunatus sp.]|nr:ChrB domain-containing protein [Microlunatus sp.]
MTTESPGSGPSPWLVLVYRVPSEPTRLRATVWRRLKALGAVYLQNSVAALPHTPANERALRKLQREISRMEGTGVLLESAVLSGEQSVLQIFQAARADEYEEIVDRCQGFLAEVENEYTKKHFTYAELEENEVDYTKLVNWLDKVRSRDHFQAPGRAEAEAALAKCEQVLENYAARVYAEEAEGH